MNKFVFPSIVLLSTFLVAGCLNFQEASYKSEAIEKEAGAEYPSEFHINGITWIATEKSYCIPTCLQMIGEWNGVHEPIEYYTWLSGFSYGATYKDSFASFMPISDAMRGLMFASEYLGLKRILRGTADKQDYIYAVKNELSQNHPVMIFYDYNVLTDDSFFFPHAAILTGYDENSFYYYEPGFHDEFTPDAGRGKQAPIKVFMQGIMNLNRKFGLSDGYHYMVYEKTEKRTDYKAVWKRNSEVSKGISLSFINLYTGINSYLALATEIKEKELPDWAWEILLPVWISYGSYSRRDNAEFIQSRFSSKTWSHEVSEALMKSSEKFTEIETILESDEYGISEYRKRIPELLINLASVEEDLAELLDNIES